MDEWEREEIEYYDYIDEQNRFIWNQDSLARMKDGAFGVGLELRQFLEFSDHLVRKELAGDNQFDVWELWAYVRKSQWRGRRLNDAPLSRWLSRTNSFSAFTDQVRNLLSNKPSRDREVLAVQSLLKSWVDEATTITLDDYAPWQGVTFFYSIESALATLVYLLSPTNITSHADVLNQFRSLFVTPLRSSLFAPVNFTYRRLQDEWTCDWNLPANSVIETCPLIIRYARERGRHGGWITYFHLIHAMSELYRYKSSLPFMMTSKPRLRNNGLFFWDLLLPIKLWLEVMICEAIEPETMADLVKMARHRLSSVHRVEIPSLEMRWEVMQTAGILNLSKRGLSSKTESIFQAIRYNPLSIDW